MLAKDRRATIFTSILILLPLLAGLLSWNKHASSIAFSVDLNFMTVDFSDKFMGVIVMPLAVLFFHLLLAIQLSKSPSRKAIGKMYTLIICVDPLISIWISYIIYPYILGIKIDPSLLTDLLVGVFLITGGNYYPKIKRNGALGMKFPWTCANEENWNRTHHLAGILYMLLGMYTIMRRFIHLPDSPAIIGIAILLVIIVSAGYSYFLHVKKNL